MLTAFYQASSQLCFTLLGLWWLVLQTKYSEWIGDSARRHLATTISLYFLLPGSMSLFALLGADIPLLWRTSFAIASALGALATAPVWDVRRPGFAAGGFIAARWLGVALYLVVLAISIVPGVAHLVHTAPLLPAGISLSLLIVLGVGLAGDSSCCHARRNQRRPTLGKRGDPVAVRAHGVLGGRRRNIAPELGERKA